MSDGVEAQYNTLDGQVGEGVCRYAANLLASRVKPGEAGTLCVSQVLDHQSWDCPDAAMTPDVASRRADAPRDFRFRSGIVELGLVERARRCAAPLSLYTGKR